MQKTKLKKHKSINEEQMIKFIKMADGEKDFIALTEKRYYISSYIKSNEKCGNESENIRNN